MEPTISVTNGICRCCASEGTFKDIRSKFHWMGDEEVYSDMLKQCFDITLSTSEHGDGGICEVCITQLRNAANFKKQVQHTEEQFLKLAHERLFKSAEMVKVEIDPPLDEDSDSDNRSDDYIEFKTPVKEERSVLEEVKSKKRAASTRASTSTSRAKKPKKETGGTSTKKDRDDYSCNCQICDQQYTSVFNLKRHLLTIHGVEATMTSKKLCDGCGKVFYNNEWLAKHLAVGCPKSKSRICVQCNVVFDRTADMYKHMRRMHWSEQKLLKLNCPLCPHTLRSHEDHDQHLSAEHGVKLNYENVTFDNEKDFNQWREEFEKRDGVCFIKRMSPAGFYYHCYPIKYLGKSRIPGRVAVCPARMNVIEAAGVWAVSYQSTHICNLARNVRKKDGTIVHCSECSVQLDSYEELNNHLTCHDIEVETERLKFNTRDDFITWKSHTEIEQNVKFFKRTTVLNKKSEIEKSYYFCNKSASLLTKKSHKAPNTCPARITATLYKTTDKSDVIHVKTHLGHPLKTDVPKLTKEERILLADRIKKGDNLKTIIKESKEGAPANSRLHELRRIDLYNIIRDFNIDKSTVNYGRVKKDEIALNNGAKEFVPSEPLHVVENSNKCVDFTQQNASLIAVTAQTCVKPTKVYILKF